MSESQVLVAWMLWQISSTTKCSREIAVNTVRDALQTADELLSEINVSAHKERCTDLQKAVAAMPPVPPKTKDLPGQTVMPFVAPEKPAETELVIAKRGKPGKADLVVAMPKPSAPAAPQTAIPAPVAKNSASDDWNSVSTPATPPACSVAVSAPPPLPPPPPVPPPNMPVAPWAKADCIACAGTGYNSKGGACAVCKASKVQEAAVTPLSAPAATVAPTLRMKPKPAIQPTMQVLYTEMLCDTCQDDQIVFTLPQNGEGPAKAKYTCQKCNTVGETELSVEMIAAIKQDGRVIATTVSTTPPEVEKRGRKKADPVARLPIQQPPDEKSVPVSVTPPDIRKLVDGIVGYESPPINCEATRLELNQSVNNWPKDRVIKKWEELSGKVWKENEMPIDRLKSEIVNGLLGKIGVE